MIQKKIQNFAHLQMWLLGALALQAVQTAPADVQPANQPANQPAYPPPEKPLESAPANQHAPLGYGQQPVRLPNINIYINRNEIRKLLGIDSRINYVTNGNTDPYPFGFTIPLGYNQTDMIFTWQNLGQTNVNYSISLVIGNIQAVEAPLINITRSGLIPTHEQVFKITLPCSGKMSVEVDFQVLINITGYVAEEELAAAAQPVAPPAAANADDLAEPAQSDQAPEAPKLRLVSHTLTLNRKKICTIHPVPVAGPPAGRSAVLQRQPAPISAGSGSQQPQTATSAPPANQNSPASAHNGNPIQNLPSPVISPNKPPEHPNRQPPTVSVELTPPELSGEPAARNPFPLDPADLIPDEKSMSPAASRRSQPAVLGAYANNWPRRDKPPVGNDMDLRTFPMQPQQVGSSNSPLLFTLVALSLLISAALIWVAVLGSGHSTSPAGTFKRSPLDKLSNFTGNLLRRAPASQMVAGKCGLKGAQVGAAGNVISSFRVGPKSQASSMSGLSAISGGPFSAMAAVGGQKQTGGSISPAHCAYKPTCAANGYYTTSRASQHQQPYYSAGTHHYQHPPTADLLGTGYQCQPQQLPVVPPPQYPIHHMAAAAGHLSHTTRLIWNSGNGTNPDGFTIENSYMPLSNAPRSEGSAYQTIY